jgi:hypothetical protein
MQTKFVEISFREARLNRCSRQAIDQAMTTAALIRIRKLYVVAQRNTGVGPVPRVTRVATADRHDNLVEANLPCRMPARLPSKD